MASQYVPSDRIQAALVGVFLLYCAYLKSKSQWSSELNSIAPGVLAIFVASVCSIMNLVTYSQYCAILAVACLLFANYLRMGAFAGKIKGL